MKARRRELERRRREKALKRLEKEEELTAKWGRIRGVVLYAVLVVVVFFGYWRLQVRYPDNRWPLELVWMMMVVGIFGVFGWTLWYISKGD